MLYLYDRAICDDIKASINSENANPNVFISSPEIFQSVLAQIQQDTITYPLVLIARDEDMPIISDLNNFTKSHFGVPAAIDTKTNTIYHERVLPVDLQYTVRILSTNVADSDEFARELFYKYLSMYYLTIRLPYEADRKIRFGVEVDLSYGIKRDSGNVEYVSTGALYQSSIHLKTNGCVSLSYTGRHLERQVYSDTVDLESPAGPKN